MTITAAAELGHRMHDAFNRRDYDAIETIFAPDFHSHPLGAGRDALKTVWKTMAGKYPNAQTIIDEVIATGDLVALRATVHGITPDGKPATLLEMFRVKDEQISEIWGATSTRHG